MSDNRTELQKAIGLPADPVDSAEPHTIIKSQLDQVDDEVDFMALQKTTTSTDKDAFKQDHVWEPEFLEFSKWIRKTYFKDVNIQKMQEINTRGVYRLFGTVFLQLTMYWALYLTVPQYFWLWGLPLFMVHLYLNQAGEVLHTRTHWPKSMTGSELLDTLVDSFGIVITGTSKETLRRRHIAAHYVDISNVCRLFSEFYLPFSTMPPTMFLYPHKLLLLFIDVEKCRRENLSRQQLLVEMIGLYTYLAVLCYETLFCSSCYLLVFHLLPSLVFGGAQFMGAVYCHSGVDKRNSFNSNGLFDWREAKGLFKVSLFIVDTLAHGGCSNHGIHHAHTQLPLELVNANLREINAHCLKTYKDVRYNQLLAHKIFKDLWESFPEPKWYDYIIQGIIITSFVLIGCLIFLGIPVPPPNLYEYISVDYRILFLATKQERLARWLEAIDNGLKMTARSQFVQSPNAYLSMMTEMIANSRQQIKNLPQGRPVPKGLAESLCPKEIREFTILRPLEVSQKKTQ